MSHIKSIQQKDRVLILFSLFIMWMALRGYDGFIHDARLYTLQAISFNNEILRNTELLTKFFNQGDFSLFSFIHFIFIKVFGTIEGSFILYLVCQSFYFYAYYKLVEIFFSHGEKYFHLIFISLIIIESGYLSDIFRINETFITSRIPAEAFSILAFSKLYNNKFITSIFFATISLILHPLIGIWFFVIGINFFLLNYLGFRKWLITISILFVTVVSLIYLKNSVMTAEWYNYLHQSKVYLFPSQWGGIVWDRYFHTLGVCIVAYLSLKNKTIKNFILTLIVISLFCLIMSCIGELIKSQFIIKLQFWRINYLLFITAVIFSAYYFVKNNTKLECFVFCLLLCFSWVTRDFFGSFFIFLFLLTFVLEKIHPKIISLISTSLDRIKILFLILFLFPYTIDLYYFFFKELGNLEYLSATILDGSNMLLFSYFFTIYLLFRNVGKRHFFYSIIFSLVIIVIHYFNYSKNNFDIEKMTIGNLIKQYVKEGETVFWKNREIELLLFANRPSYFSSTQLIPAIFSEKLFDEGNKRYKNLRGAGVNDFFFDEYHLYIKRKDNALNNDSGQEDNINFYKLCDDEKLDYFIIPSRGQTGKVFVYEFKYRKVYWKVYSCKEYL